MNWVVFSYSLPSSKKSSPRVTLWRRLHRLGAVSPVGGTHVLPSRDECIEAFQWLAQEIQQTGGRAFVMHVQQFDGLTDQQLIDFFHSTRAEDYTEIESEAVDLEKLLAEDLGPHRYSQVRESLAKLQRQRAEIARIDYFDCPQGTLVETRLARIAQALAPDSTLDPEVKPASVADYKDKRWVTRPRPHVDRLACAWFIRRYINSDAVIRYSEQREPDEVAFDMNEAEFGHIGNFCTFETMIRAFNVDAPGLIPMARIVHEVDLRDERYLHPETIGIDAVLKGWLSLDLSDPELETYGIALFDGLLDAMATQLG